MRQLLGHRAPSGSSRSHNITLPHINLWNPFRETVNRMTIAPKNESSRSPRPRAALDRLAGELGIPDKVHFVGERSDVRSLLAGLDLFVLASREEGLGTALLEAMASGVPVVANATGGIVEVVEDSVSGLLVPPGDVDRLAELIVTLLHNRELADRLSENGRQRVAEKFSIETTVEKTQRLYDELLEARLGRQWTSRKAPEER